LLAVDESLILKHWELNVLDDAKVQKEVFFAFGSNKDEIANFLAQKSAQVFFIQERVLLFRIPSAEIVNRINDQHHVNAENLNEERLSVCKIFIPMSFPSRIDKERASTCGKD
jgi:hypothetical protein